MIHETRIIPLVARAHVGQSIRAYMKSARPLGGRHAGGRDDEFKDQIADQGPMADVTSHRGFKRAGPTRSNGGHCRRSAYLGETLDVAMN